MKFLVLTIQSRDAVLTVCVCLQHLDSSVASSTSSVISSVDSNLGTEHLPTPSLVLFPPCSLYFENTHLYLLNKYFFYYYNTVLLLLFYR